MAEIKKTEATVKPVATIKTPVAATATKTPEVKVAAPAAKPEAKKAEAKKPAAKKPATKKPAAKKPAAKKAEQKKAEAKKPAAKKTTTKPAAKKPATKTTAKKPTAKKAPAKKPAAKKTEAVQVSIELQYSYKHIPYEKIVEDSKNNFAYEMGGNVNDIKKLSIYVKPSEDAAYYVVNDKVQGRIGLE